MAIFKGTYLVFGLSKCPPLPDGWGFKRQKGLKPAIAIAPSGEKYLIGKDVLYPYEGQHGRSHSADFSNPIPFPK